MKTVIKKYFPPFSIVFLCFFIVTAIIWYCSTLNAAFADAIIGSIGYGLRRALAFLTGFVGFSLMELTFVGVIIALIISVILTFRRSVDKVRVIRRLIAVISIFSLAVSLYAFTLGIGYHSTALSKKLGLDSSEPINTDSLKSTLIILKDKAEQSLDGIEFDENGASICPMSISEISSKICRAYDVIAAEYKGLRLNNFNSTAKVAISSRALLGLQITGVYSFFTGEANVSIVYPDYTIPFTIAHELAHQRGISRENEANFMAFLACIYADDAYLNYCGYMNMLEYVASSLNKVSPEIRKEIYAGLDPRIKGEMRAYSDFYYKNRNELLADISHFFNDNYLKLQGTEGIVSYGLVTELCVEYYNNTGLTE